MFNIRVTVDIIEISKAKGKTRITPSEAHQEEGKEREIV
jgi:hypothetical protein